MTLPALLHILLFRYATMFGIAVAFEDYKPIGGALSFIKSKWVWLANFRYLWLLRNQLVTVVRNTVGMNLLFIAFGMVSAIAIALMVFEIYHSHLCRLYQSAMILPSLLSIVIVAYFVDLFFCQAGVANQILARLGLGMVKWFQRPEYWPGILLVVRMWLGAGMGSFFYVAYLLGIDPTLFEAARMDGANKWQEIRYVTIPMLSPLIIFSLVMSMAGIVFGDFGLFYIVTQSEAQAAVRRTTEVVDTFVYRTLRSTTAVSGGPSKAAAASLLQSVVGLGMIVLANYIVRRIDKERAIF